VIASSHQSGCCLNQRIIPNALAEHGEVLKCRLLVAEGEGRLLYPDNALQSPNQFGTDKRQEEKQLVPATVELNWQRDDSTSFRRIGQHSGQQHHAPEPFKKPWT
jgi:hypothetical protein